MLFTGYVAYDLLHFYLHHGSPEEGSHFYYMKRYHNQHHFTHYETGKMQADRHNI
jgi:4-hydroxysphinganine ceramide fatty acyl 2-hydroxylase